MTMNEIKAWDKEKVSRQQLNELEERLFSGCFDTCKQLFTYLKIMRNSRNATN